MRKFAIILSWYQEPRLLGAKKILPEYAGMGGKQTTGICRSKEKITPTKVCGGEQKKSTKDHGRKKCESTM